MSKANRVCRECGVNLNDGNWYPSCKKNSDYICKVCDCKRRRLWRNANPNKVKATWVKAHRKQGAEPYNKNKECSLFLGVHIAERVLSHVFKDVRRMSTNNPGYDFICNQGYFVDVKSACMTSRERWVFTIKRNTVTDYFLCLAFDNRQNLNPLYMWLLPGKEFNHLTGVSINVKTLHKWDKHLLDTSELVNCCNTIRHH